jgi:hypothetical protein
MHTQEKVTAFSSSRVDAALSGKPNAGAFCHSRRNFDVIPFRNGSGRASSSVFDRLQNNAL